MASMTWTFIHMSVPIYIKISEESDQNNASCS